MISADLLVIWIPVFLEKKKKKKKKGKMKLSKIFLEKLSVKVTQIFF